MNHTYSLCEEGDFENAIQYFEVVVKNNPYNIQLIIDMGVTLGQM